MKTNIYFISILIMFFHSAAFTQSWEWVRMYTYGYGGGNEAQNLCVDSVGNNYVTGYFAGISVWGTDTLVSTLDLGYTPDVFVLKQDNLGNVVWARKACSIGDNRGKAIATDYKGNIYVTGIFQDTLIFDNISIDGESDYTDIFIAKYSPEGNILWAKSINGPVMDEARDISVSDNGNIYITGYFTDSISFGNYSLSTNSYTSLFIAKYDSLGNFIWARNPSGPGATYGYSITTDSEGDIYVSGGYKNYTIFDSITLPNIGQQDIFIAKYDQDGNVMWAKNAGGDYYDLSYCIKADKNGHIYVTGYISGTAFFDSIAVSTPGNVNSDIFLTKYTITGDLVWVTSIGSEGVNSNDCGLKITTNNTGDVYITGYYSGSSLTVAGNVFNNSGSSDMVILKYSNSGNLLWGAKIGGNIFDEPTGIDTDFDGNLYVAGYCWGSTTGGNITFGDTTIFFNPYKSFIAKLDTGINIVVNELKNAFNILVFPNPSFNTATLEFDNLKHENHSLSLFDTQGQLVFLISNITTGQVEIEKKNLASGLYFFQLRSDKQVIATGKFIIE